MTRGFTLIALTKGGGRRSANPDAERKHRYDDPSQGRPVGEQEREERSGRYNADSVGDDDETGKGKAGDQLACEKAAKPKPGNKQRKVQANARAGRMQPIDKNERRAGDERIERGRRATATDCVAQKLPRAQQANVVASVARGADEERLRTRLRQNTPRKHEVCAAQGAEPHQNLFATPKGR